MKVLQNPRFLIIFIAVIAVAIMRWFPHINNFAPIAAMALFAGAFISNKRFAFLVPLIAMLISDLGLEIMYHVGLRAYPGFHSSMLFVYIGFLLAVGLGILIQNRKSSVIPVTLAAISGSIIFFLVTNFGAWVVNIGGMYSNDFSGLLSSMVAGIPFYKNSLIGDLFYTLVFFGGYQLISIRFPKLKEAEA